MKRAFYRILHRLLRIGSSDLDTDEIRLSKYVIVAGFTAAALMNFFFTGPIYVFFGEVPAGLNYMIHPVLTLVNIAWFARHHDHRKLDAVMATLTVLSNTLTVVFLGDFINSGAAALWGVCYPMIGMLIFYGVRRSFLWSIPVMCNIALSVFFGYELRADINVPDPVKHAILLTNLITICGIIAGALAYFVDQRNMAFALLREEQGRSEDLLRNILPVEIAAQLKLDRRTIAERYEQASVLFADIADFTPLSSSLAPEELVEMLNKIFSHFDDLADHFGLEKIKTIGDCYMVASGVPKRRADHAQVMARMALEIQRYMEDFEFKGKPIRLRIGINSGPLVAGVIGKKKFIYDLWGDAVNTASRMESHGQAGTIQITQDTFDLIKDTFDCTPQGQVNVKGKGSMDVFRLTGETALRVTGTTGLV